MHSSPPLGLLLGRGAAAAFIAAGALVGVACQDANESEGTAPPTTRDAATTDASTQSSGMTRVGAPSTPSGASGAKAPAEQDASAPNPPGPMRAGAGTRAAPDLTCSTDAACKTFDSMCGACRCLILPAQMEPPACTEPEVACLIAPCLDKRAVCSNAMCALQDQGPNAM